MLVEFLSRIDGCLLDGLEEEFGHSRLFDVDEMRLEHAFGSFEPFGSDFDDSAIGELDGGEGVG